MYRVRTGQEAEHDTFEWPEQVVYQEEKIDDQGSYEDVDDQTPTFGVWQHIKEIHDLAAPRVKIREWV